MDPLPHEVNIEDIAHSLSMLCRFNGHMERFYSVAEHSVYVSQLVTGKNQIWGLLHDAAEAYLSDVPSPVKKHLPQFKEIENGLQKIIAIHFNLSPAIPPEVKHADMVLLATEKKVLMKPEPDSWGELPAPSNKITIAALPPDMAKALFIKRFRELSER